MKKTLVTLCLMMLSLLAMAQSIYYSKDLEKRAKAGDAQAQGDFTAESLTTRICEEYDVTPQEA